METALIDGDVAFREHSGGHTTGPSWPVFLAFADRYIKVRLESARVRRQGIEQRMCATLAPPPGGSREGRFAAGV